MTAQGVSLCVCTRQQWRPFIAELGAKERNARLLGSSKCVVYAYVHMAIQCTSHSNMYEERTCGSSLCANISQPSHHCSPASIQWSPGDLGHTVVLCPQVAGVIQTFSTGQDCCNIFFLPCAGAPERAVLPNASSS
ncbi:hypothetical protein NDU88_003647 [Pleurodeles waltl]|uniref:Uncharacterized protein n=1 Tax=Pleurodeles waltl TaxID=8319 RepID=A0AAV7QAA7_PLEWA|nr:hypothetical protein NDU88_003647 [Pleurodeles waltl]